MSDKENNSSNKLLKISLESIKHNETNDCSVRALALACDINYDKAHEIFKSLGRKNRQGVPRCITYAAITLAGKSIEHVDIKNFILSKYPKSKHKLKTVTTKHPSMFNNVWKDGNNYMMFVNGHVLPIIDGEVVDWTNGRSFRANTLIKIINKEES